MGRISVGADENGGTGVQDGLGVDEFGFGRSI